MKQWKCALVLAGVAVVSACAGSDSTAEPIDAATWQAYLAEAAAADQITDWTDRCLAYPDLPGNQWPPGSARARCALFAEGRPTLPEIEAMLDAPGGPAQLEQLYAETLAAHYDDPARREGIFGAYLAFDRSEEAERVAARWSKLAPDSAFARYALASVFVGRASQARGENWISETPAADLQTMERWLARGAALARAALEIEPRLSPACARMMYIARLGGDSEMWRETAEHCLRVDPLSWNLRFEWQMGLHPRWRRAAPREDPFAALDQSVEEIRPLVAQNPALGSMLARGVGLRGYLAPAHRQSHPATLRWLEEAAIIGPDPIFIGAVGEAAHRQGDYTRALGYYSQAIRLAPANARFRIGRADTRRKLGDLEGAVSDAREAITLDGTIGSYHGTLAQALSRLGRIDEARVAFADAMQFPVQRLWASRRWCETFILHGLQPDEALACTEDLVAEFPQDAEAHFMRSWVLYETGDADAAEASARRFHALADPGDVRHGQMKSELARISGRG